MSSTLLEGGSLLQTPDMQKSSAALLQKGHVTQRCGKHDIRHFFSLLSVWPAGLDCDAWRGSLAGQRVQLQGGQRVQLAAQWCGWSMTPTDRRGLPLCAAPQVAAAWPGQKHLMTVQNHEGRMFSLAQVTDSV